MDWQYHTVGWRLDPDGWHPDVPADTTFGALDLRETRNLNSANGICILATPLGFTGLPPGALTLAEDPDEILSTGRINSLSGRLGLGGIDPPDKRFCEVMAHILRDLGDDGRADRHNTLKRTSGRGQIEIRNGRRMAIQRERLSIGARLIDREVGEYEYLGNTIVAEDNFSTGWTSANEGLNGRTPDTTQPASNVWAADAGWGRANSESSLRYTNTFGDEANIDCNITDGKVGIYYDPSGQDQDVWLTARSGVGTSNPDKYLGASSYHSDNCRMRRVVSGVTTTIATRSSLSWTNSELGTHAISVDGSNLEMFYSASDTLTPAQYGTDIDASPFTATDTNITTGDQWGISGFNRKANDHRVHRFWVDDLAGAATYEDAVSVGLSQGYTAAPDVTAEGNFSLGVSQAVVALPDVTIEGALSLAVSKGMATLGAVTVEGMTGLGLNQAIDNGPQNTIEGAAPLALSQGVTAAAVVAANAALNFALAHGVDLAGGLVLEDTVALTVEPGQASTGGLGLEDSIALAMSNAVAASNDVDFFTALALGLSPGVSQGAVIVYEAALSIEARPGIAGDAAATFDVAVLLSAQQTIAELASVSVEAAATIAAQLAQAVVSLTTSEQAPPFRTISIAADPRSAAPEADDRSIKVSRDNRTIIISGD